MPDVQLTELEGAVLTEVGHRDNDTAFKVRRAFELSGSANWRGSAGAVYAAVRRLTARGLLDSLTIPGKRGGKRLALTRSGNAALRAWMLDYAQAADSGFDPFRLRAGLWLSTGTAELEANLKMLKLAVAQEIERLEAYKRGQDAIERVEIDLAIRLQEVRLDWIAEQREALRGS